MIDQITNKDYLSFFDYCTRKKYLTDRKKIKLLYKSIIKFNIPCFVHSDWTGFILCYQRHLFLVVDNIKVADDLLRIFLWNHNQYCKITLEYSVDFHKLLMKYRFKLVNRNGKINTYECLPRIKKND